MGEGCKPPTLSLKPLNLSYPYQDPISTPPLPNICSTPLPPIVTITIFFLPLLSTVNTSKPQKV